MAITQAVDAAMTARAGRPPPWNRMQMGPCGGVQTGAAIASMLRGGQGISFPAGARHRALAASLARLGDTKSDRQLRPEGATLSFAVGERPGGLSLPAPGHAVVLERSEGAGHRIRCPRCNGYVDRIRRRLFDRIVSLFTPVRRYRCWNHDCKWEANLRHDVTKQATPQHRRAK